jgi:GNAT superfamily N-acetyltransferase
MTLDDVPAAERVSDEGFFELDTRQHRASDPAPERRSEAHRGVWIERTRHLVRTDPGGCWVAEDEAGMVGMATSFRRETLWCLATYAVLPGRQGQGIGKPLLAAALDHGRACTRSMLSASSDAKAVRIYRQAGFDLHPDCRPGRDPRRGEGPRGQRR